jgi:hypothetical protein
VGAAEVVPTVVSAVTVVVGETLVLTAVSVLVTTEGLDTVVVKVVSKVEVSLVTVAVTSETVAVTVASPYVHDYQRLVLRCWVVYNSNTYGRGRSEGRNVSGDAIGEAQVVAPGNHDVGLLDVASADRDGAVVNAVSEVDIAAQASNISIRAAELGALVEHGGAANSLHAFMRVRMVCFTGGLNHGE